MIQTNKLTERLELQTLVLSGSSFGENIETWTTYQVIWGSITKQGGKLQSTLVNESYDDTISFYCRYLSNFEQKSLKVLYNNRSYKVVNVTPISRKTAMVIDLSLFI